MSNALTVYISAFDWTFYQPKIVPIVYQLIEEDAVMI